MDRRFVYYFTVVTGVLAAAVYLTAQAAKSGGVVLTLLAAITATIGILGFTGLARVVVIAEREGRQK